jgi:hypothetical protein
MCGIIGAVYGLPLEGSIEVSTNSRVFIYMRDEEEMLTLSLRMEVDSVQYCLITKVFEVMSIWRLFHSIY